MKEDVITMLPDEQKERLIKYFKSPWIEIDKIGILNDGEGIKFVVGYHDILGTVKRVII